MKHARALLAALLAFGSISTAWAEVWHARYGVAETFNFKLYNADGTLDVDEADGGTEVSLSCNEGAETTATNDFADEGTFYSIALTAAEMQCERIAVVIAATTTEVFFIQTHSNASAMTPTEDVDVQEIGGAAVSTSTAQLGVNVVNAGGTAWGSGAITAASIATDAIGAAEIASAAIAADEIAADAIGSSEIAADAIGASELASAAIAADEIATDAIGAAEIAADAIAASEVATDAIGAAELAANAIGAAEIADGAIDGNTYACPATAGAMAALGIIDCGTAQAATGTTLQLRAAAAFADDEIIGATCLVTGGSAGVGQARTVSDYVSSTDTATVATWTTTPTGTITYVCFGTATGSSGSVTIAAGGITASSFASGAIDSAAIATDAIGAAELAADAIGASELASAAIAADEIATDAIGAAELAADAVGTSEIATDAITATEVAADALGASEIAASAIGSSELADGGITSAEFGSGAITATVIATDALGAAELAADAVTEVQSGLATSSALSTLSTTIGSPAGASLAADIAAIEDQTDELAAFITDVGVNGAGLTALPWNAAYDAEVQSEVTDALNLLLLTEPAAKPTWGSSTVWDGIAWLTAWSRNKVTQSTTTKTLRNDADNSNLVTCTVSDAGGVFTLSECSP